MLLCYARACMGSSLSAPCLSRLHRESAANLVRSGSQPRQPWRDAAKGSETPQTGAPSTFVSTFLKRYPLPHSGCGQMGGTCMPFYTQLASQK